MGRRNLALLHTGTSANQADFFVDFIRRDGDLKNKIHVRRGFEDISERIFTDLHQHKCCPSGYLAPK